MNDSVYELVHRRYSCRRYVERPLEEVDRRSLVDRVQKLGSGPFGNRPRLALLTTSETDGHSLKGLGTYGTIRGATGFIAGCVPSGPGDMEDYGYCLQSAVLEATDLDLGTCWLGGSFTKSSFAARIGAAGSEVVPAVVAVGYPAENSRSHWIRRRAGSERRLRPEQLFFVHDSGRPLQLHEAGEFATVLEAVRWAPSASNKQPWRLLRSGEHWHFYLQRTDGYNKGPLAVLLKIADLQRVDMGIAMCHFDLVARECGLTGRWSTETPPSPVADSDWQYTLSWVPEGH